MTLASLLTVLLAAGPLEDAARPEFYVPEPFRLEGKAGEGGSRR